MVAPENAHVPPAGDSIRIETSEGLTTLRLEGAIGVAQARALHARALELASQGGDVTVRASLVSHLDAAAVQVLIALSAALKSRGRTLAIADLPVSVSHTLQLAGLGTAL
jgi:anti-anti-sigma factor